MGRQFRKKIKEREQDLKERIQDLEARNQELEEEGREGRTCKDGPRREIGEGKD